MVEGAEQEVIPTPTMGYFKDVINEYLINLEKTPNYKMNFREAIMDLDIVLSSYRSAEKKEIVKFKALGDISSL